MKYGHAPSFAEVLVTKALYFTQIYVPGGDSLSRGFFKRVGENHQLVYVCSYNHIYIHIS